MLGMCARCMVISLRKQRLKIEGKSRQENWDRFYGIGVCEDDSMSFLFIFYVFIFEGKNKTNTNSPNETGKCKSQ